MYSLFDSYLWMEILHSTWPNLVGTVLDILLWSAAGLIAFYLFVRRSWGPGGVLLIASVLAIGREVLVQLWDWLFWAQLNFMLLPMDPELFHLFAAAFRVLHTWVLALCLAMVIYAVLGGRPRRVD